ncbi:MAG: PAS domain-containing sensor histidine kinase [Candidatus Kapaibacterium sp.]
MKNQDNADDGSKVTGNQNYDINQYCSSVFFQNDSLPSVIVNESTVISSNNALRELIGQAGDKAKHGIHDYRPELLSEIIELSKLPDYEIVKKNLKYELNGNTIYFRLSANTFQQANKTYLKISLIDITKQLLSENTISDEQANFRKYIQETNYAYQSLDINGNILDVNEIWLRALGYEKEEVAGRNFKEFITGEYRAVFNERFSRFKEKGSVTDIVFDMIKKGGDILTVSYEGRIAYNKNGDIICTHCFFKDITKQKEFENRLTESEKKYRLLFESAPLGIFTSVPEGYFTDVNHTMARMFGYRSREEMLRMVTDIKKQVYANPHDRYNILKILENTGDIQQHEFTFRRKDGTHFIANLYIKNINFGKGRPHFEGMVEDITVRKRAEDAYRKSEREKDLILSSVSESLVFYDKDIRIIWANLAAEKFYDKSINNIVGRICYELRDLEKKPENCPVIKTLESGEPAMNEMKWNNSWWIVRSYPVFDNDNILIGAVEIARDITEKKNAVMMLESSEKRLKEAFDAANEGIWEWNIPSGTIYLSPRCYTMIEYEPYEYEPEMQIWEQSIHPDDRGRVLNILNEKLISGDEYRVEFRQRTKSGNYKWIQSKGKVIEYDNEANPLRMIGTHIDIGPLKKAEQDLQNLNKELEYRVIERTRQLEESNIELLYEIEERKRVEQELSNANKAKEKLLSIIGHALRNPVQALLLSSHLLVKREYDDSYLLKKHEQIFNASRSLSALLEQLLDWARARSRRLEVRQEVVGLNEIIADNFDTVENLAQSKDIRLINTIGSGRKVFADRNMLNAIIRNLLINAIKFTRSQGFVKVEYFRANNHDCLTVTDNGVGMSDEELAKLFRLDVTFTKTGTNNEKGTGLGLIIIKEFIDMHNGSVEVKSSPGKGSKFTVKLPALNDNN